MRVSKWRVFVFVLIFVGLGLFLVYENCPVVQSEKKIRKNMLKKFPLATKRRVVWATVNKDYRVNPYYAGNTGWRDMEFDGPVIGVSHIRATISDVHLASVDVIWMFDKNDKLIDIAAWRTIDLL
jgi:hypothetical protein